MNLFQWFSSRQLRSGMYVAFLTAISVGIHACGDVENTSKGSDESAQEQSASGSNVEPANKPIQPSVSTSVSTSNGDKPLVSIQAKANTPKLIVARVKTSDLKSRTGTVEFVAIDDNVKLNASQDLGSIFANGRPLKLTQNIAGLVASDDHEVSVGLKLAGANATGQKEITSAYGYPSIGCIGCGLGNYSAGVGLLNGVVQIIGGLFNGSINNLGSFLAMLNPFTWINGNNQNYSNIGSTPSGTYQYFPYLRN